MHQLSIAALLTAFAVLATPAAAQVRLAEAGPAHPLDWHFGAALAAGVGPGDSFDHRWTGAASAELTAGHDLSQRFSLEGVLALFVGPEGGLFCLGARPLYALGPHLDVGGTLALGVGSGVGLVAGPYLGLHAGALYTFLEPIAVLFPGGGDAFDRETRNDAGLSLLPLRIGFGVRF